MNPSERVRRATEHLISGWDERIEYKELVKYHVDLCTVPVDCCCPDLVERRARTVRHGALLAQLGEAVRDKGQGSNGGGGGGKPGSRPPVNMRPLELLDEIHHDAQEWHDAMHTELYGSEPSVVRRATPMILFNSLALAERLAHIRPTVVMDYARVLEQHQRQARIVLGYDRPQSTLADTACGECGGYLAVASDASSDVRCIGTDTEPACGLVYQRWLWLELANQLRLVGTDEAVRWLARDGLSPHSCRRTLYRWAQEGKIKNHGGTGRREALWSMAQIEQVAGLTCPS